MTPQQLQAIKDTVEKNESYWWCPDCRIKVDARNVTFQECHDSAYCGHGVEWVDGKDSMLAALLAEIERLTSCLKFEQNYLSRVGTHADGCYKWGPGHWDCAVQEIERLQAENEGMKCCGNCARWIPPYGREYGEIGGCKVSGKPFPLRVDKCDKWEPVK